jgi:hypothetical protein
VTQIQVDTDRALIADRLPAQQAIELLGAHHDRMSGQLDLARQLYADGASVYDDMTAQLGTVDSGIERLAQTLAAIETLSASLPEGFSLPRVPTLPTRSTGTGGSIRPPSTVPKVAPAPTPAPPPPTSATTGASGGG